MESSLTGSNQQRLILVLLFLLYISCNGQRYVAATIMAFCDNDLEIYQNGGSTPIKTDYGRSYREPVVFQITPQSPNIRLSFHCKDLGGGGGFAAILTYLDVNYTTTYPITASFFDLISSDDNIIDPIIYEQREGLNYSTAVNFNQFDLNPYWWWNDNILNTMIFEFDFSKILFTSNVQIQCNNKATIYVSLPGDSGSKVSIIQTGDSLWPDTLAADIMVAPQSYVEVVCQDTAGSFTSFIGTFSYFGNKYPTKSPVTSPTADWRLQGYNNDGCCWFASWSSYTAHYGNNVPDNPNLHDAQATWTGNEVWKSDQDATRTYRIYFGQHYNYSFMRPFTLSPTPSPTEHIVCTPNSTHPACNRYESLETVGICDDVHNLYIDSAAKSSEGLSTFEWFCIILGCIIMFLLICELILYVIWSCQDQVWQTQHHWFDVDKKQTFLMSIGRVMNWLFHFVVLFWCVLATFYGINQLYRLSYSNFWCDGPAKTVEEIHEYNYINQCKTGDKDSCYSTDAIIDFYKVRTNNPSDLYKSEKDINPENVTYAVLFFILAAIFLLLSIFHLFKFIKACKTEIDTGCCLCCICCKDKKKMDGDENEENKEEQKELEDDKENKEEEEKKENDENKEDPMEETENCPIKCVKRIIRFYKTHLELDSTFSVQFMIFMKFFNIIAQISYLCALGGTSLIYVLTGNNEEVILAEYPKFIIILSCVIFADTLFVCIIWFLYGIFPHIFFGVQFKFLNVFIDLTFKLIYSLFPIIVHGTISHLGLFQFKTFARFFGPFVAMLFMVWKIHKILAQSRELAETGGIINHQHDNVMGEDDINSDEFNRNGMNDIDGESEMMDINGKHVEGKEKYRRHWNVDNYMEVSVYRWDKLTNQKYGKDYLKKLKEKEMKEKQREIWIMKHKRKMDKAKKEGKDITALQLELEAKLAESYEIEDNEEKNGPTAQELAEMMKKDEEERVFKYSYIRGPYMEKYDASDEQIKNWNLFIFHHDDIEEKLREMIDAEKQIKKQKEKQLELEMTSTKTRKSNKKSDADKKEKVTKSDKEIKEKTNLSTKDKKEKELELEISSTPTTKNTAKPTKKSDADKKKRKRTTSKATRSNEETEEKTNEEKEKELEIASTPTTKKTAKPTKKSDADKKKQRKRTTSKVTTSNQETEEKTHLTTGETKKSDTDKKKQKKRTISKGTKSDQETEKPTTLTTKYETVANVTPTSPQTPSVNTRNFDTVDCDDFDDEKEYEKRIKRIIWCNNLKRCWLFCAALIYLTIGLIVIILVNLDLSESESFCTQIASSSLDSLSVSEWDLINEHPDLALYNDACKIKVYQLFASYPCNCRLFDLYSTDDVDSICIMKDHYNNNGNMTDLRTNDYIDASLRKWTMIERYLIGSQDEELSCLRYDGHSIINLDDTALFNAKYMQVMVLSTIKISAISSAISQYISLQALFIQYVDGFDDNTTMPWNEIGTLPLKVLQIRGIDADSNTFPVGLCGLKDTLIYFGFEWSKIINIDNCLGEFNELLYAKFAHNRITNIPWDMLQLTNIQRIAFPGNSIKGNVFIDNNIAKDFINSPSIIEMDFLWNHFCENVTLYTNNKLIIDGCNGICTKDYNSLYCNNNMIADGVCDPECNTKSCIFDGGDCIQLCDFTNCSVINIGDRTCNPECNNIECRWDGGDCDNIQCIMNPYINTYIDKPLWPHIDDGICDLHLLESNCSLFEYESDCKVCTATCYAMYLPFIKLSQGDEIITVNDWCNEELWVLVQHQLNKANIMIKNCTFFINNYRFDLNGNDITGFHEFLYLFGYNMQVKPQGIEQTDCRACMNNTDLYYL